MKKRLIALLLIAVLLIPAGIASAETWYRVNTSSLKVRMMDSESSQVLASMSRDWALTVSKTTKSGWSYVVFSNGREGYVQSKYIKKGSSYKAWVTTDNTEVRNNPNYTGTFAKLARGTQVTVLTHGSKYDYVSTSFGKGYILNARLSRKKVKPSGSKSTSTAVTGVNYDAWVNIASGHTINLYTDSNTNSAVIARYGAATKVFVVSHGSMWDLVQLDDGNQGWMLTRYLTANEPAPTAVPDPDPGQGGSTGYTAYVATANKKSVNARKGNSTNYTVLFKIPYGAPVLVLKHDTKWDYVQYNGQKGYVQNLYLQTSKPADAGEIVTLDPSATPTPKPVFQPYVTTVNVDSLNFHKKKGDWSSNVDGVGRLNTGDIVTVVKIEGDWAKVEYGSYTGWVHKKFLN